MSKEDKEKEGKEIIDITDIPNDIPNDSSKFHKVDINIDINGSNGDVEPFSKERMDELLISALTINAMAGPFGAITYNMDKKTDEELLEEHNKRLDRLSELAKDESISEELRFKASTGAFFGVMAKYQDQARKSGYNVSLLDMIPDVRKSTKKFIECCKEGKDQELLELLEDNKKKLEEGASTEDEGVVDIHMCDNVGLERATENGHHKVVKILLDKCYHTNVNVGFGAPLKGAVKGGYYETVKLLLDHGAELDEWFDEIIGLTDDNKMKKLLKSYKDNE